MAGDPAAVRGAPARQRGALPRARGAPAAGARPGRRQYAAARLTRRHPLAARPGCTCAGQHGAVGGEQGRGVTFTPGMHAAVWVSGSTHAPAASLGVAAAGCSAMCGLPPLPPDAPASRPSPFGSSPPPCCPALPSPLPPAVPTGHVDGALVCGASVHHVAADRVQHALGLAGGAACVQHEQGVIWTGGEGVRVRLA